MHSLIIRTIPVLCLPVIFLLGSQANAGWYDNDPDLNQKQGFGDFPPATIEQDLQALVGKQNGVIDHGTEQYPGSGVTNSNSVERVNGATNGTATTPQVYAPATYPAPVYGGYAPGVIAPAYGAPVYNRGPAVQVPWNRRGSGFSPWSGRGGFW